MRIVLTGRGVSINNFPLFFRLKFLPSVVTSP